MRKHIRLTATAAALAMLLALASAPGALAADGLHVRADAPASAETTAGTLYTLDLTEVFEDSSGHSLTYGMSAAGTGQHTKVVGSTFYFSEKTAGTYDITLSAACAAHGTVSHTLTVTVRDTGHGLDAQYGYDETPADYVTVYFTISSDGVPLRGEDGTPLAHVEVTVPYFDLGLYGLETYYRCHTDGGEGPYIDDEVVERPTALHLYIYVLERYYMGLPEPQCGRGDAVSGIMDYIKDGTVCNVLDVPVYDTGNSLAIVATQGPGDMFLTSFWGHNMNLMYYRNHVYPYQSPGWGATADYILLSDGDVADVALFTDFGFWSDGAAFVRFDRETYTATAGGTFDVHTSGYGTTFENTDFTDIDADRMFYLIFDENGAVCDTPPEETSGSLATICAPDAPGVYTLVGIDGYGGTGDARLAPPTATLIVTDASAPEPALWGDADGSGAVDVADVQLVCRYILGLAVLDDSALKAADVDGSGAVDTADVRLISRFILGGITAFPAETA